MSDDNNEFVTVVLCSVFNNVSDMTNVKLLFLFLRNLRLLSFLCCVLLRNLFYWAGIITVRKRLFFFSSFN